MPSYFSLENDALSCGNGHFSFQMKIKKFNIKNPAPPPGHFFFHFYFFPRKLSLFLKLLINKINGTSTPSILKKNFFILSRVAIPENNPPK